jgi:hypothetical protein
MRPSQPEGAADRLTGMRTLALIAVMAAIAGCGLAPADSATGAPPVGTAVATTPRPLIVTSVSFGSASDGWLLARPQCNRARCGQQLLASTDGGRLWHAVPAPRLRIGKIAAVTFANARDGWLYGAEVLWATHDGGARWHRVPLPPGGRLQSVTPGSGRILASIGRCGSDRLACSFRLWTAPAGSDSFRLVPGAAGARHAPQPTVAISGHTGFAYATWLDRPVSEHVLLSGPADGTHRWHRLRDPCGPSWSAALAAERGGWRLLITCGTEPGAGQQIKLAYVSANAGRTWRRVASPPSGGYVADASAAGTGPVYLSGGRMDIYISRSFGRSWHTSASLDNAAGLAGAGAVLTATAITSTRAVAFQEGVPCNQIWLTTDSGDRWTPVTVGHRPARCPR